jgi:hypothetical protein
MRTIIADLIPASGYQNATTSPSACHAFVLRTTSVHRILRPTSVTIAIRPSCGRQDARKSARDLPVVTSEIACDTMARRANHLAGGEMLSSIFRHSRAHQRCERRIHFAVNSTNKWIPGLRRTAHPGMTYGDTVCRRSLHSSFRGDALASNPESISPRAHGLLRLPARKR